MLLEAQSEIELVATVEAPKIQSLLIKEELDKKSLLLIVRTAILNCASQFKYSENMTPMQAYVLAEDLLDKMKYDSLEDILLLLKMGRRGELGSNKGRLDADVLFNLFLPAYNEAKAAQWEELHRLAKVQRQKAEEVIDTEAAAYNYGRLDDMVKYMRAEQVKKQYAKPTIDYHGRFINELKKVVHRLETSVLIEELKKAKAAKLLDAVAIYENELNQRNVKVKTP